MDLLERVDFQNMGSWQIRLGQGWIHALFL